MRDYILPYLDSISNESEYLQMVLNNPTDLLMGASVADPSICSMESPTAAIFLYSQYFLPSAMPAKEAVELWYRTGWENYLVRAEKQGHTEQNRQFHRDSKLCQRDRLLRDIDALEQEGFPTVYEAMCADMKRQLSEQLKISPDP